ncbi:GH36-type glycosyl hydrolase domain-containing protein [Vibrio tapetis]|nr:cellobiose phosphorylase [Vibrio tapetis]
MKDFFNSPAHTVGSTELRLDFNQDYALRAVHSNGLMVSMFETPTQQRPLSNLYLRRYLKNGFEVTPLLFFGDSVETFKLDGGAIGWKTQTQHVEAYVSLHTNGNAYFYDVELRNTSDFDLQYDLIFGQDVALADEGAVKTNEAYCCQYLDHQVFDTDSAGYTVCSRQNLPQSTGNPLIQIGALSSVTGYSTDCFQFFGTECKFTGEAQALQKPCLDNQKYQFEMGYIALQTQDRTLTGGESHQVTFYGLVLPDCPEANVEEPIPLEEIKSIRSASVPSWKNAQVLSPLKAEYPKLVNGEALTDKEITDLFGSIQLFPETRNGQLLSFFGNRSQYVTLAEKERYMERATGHVIASGNNVDCQNPIMSASHYIFGVFNSQLTLGNTSFNKLLGVTRNALNQFTNSGQRIHIREDGVLKTLAMPSAYEVGTNYSRWVYKYRGGYLDIRSFSSVDHPMIQLDIELVGLDTALDLEISHQLIFGNNEAESAVSVLADGNQFHVHGDNALIAASTPELAFTVLASSALSKYALVCDNGSVSSLVLKGRVTNKASISFGGRMSEVDTRGQTLDFDSEATSGYDRMRGLTNQFHLDIAKEKQNSQKLNQTMHWFTHNALVHYATPHGLEQYSGAAWGTRDVSQGPFELFMSLQKFDKAREVLEIIYSHQYQETGTWPQWFMFDNYAHIQQEEAHGDIVVWPLKALADYIVATGDTSLLVEPLPYTLAHSDFSLSEIKPTLLEHVERQIQHIEDNLVPGTWLSSYGDGDWDDTLQPANQSLRENMVSGWTIPLTLQALKTMLKALPIEHVEIRERILTLATNMEQDFNRYLIKDGVVAGFIHFDREENGEVRDIEYLLHPSDKKTGIQFRLLPASRSIISETFEPEMAAAQMASIKDKLLFPDGVRLMDQMAEYKAGKQTYFKRAELAACLGREVGLQYCHAHIRFIEALCKLGDAEAVYENLYKILPIGIESAVPNAELRQSNAYFSSSDGKFHDRYQAYQGFDLLKQGKVNVKGGWRIYSSGPGIYINQLISNVLGIRFEDGNVLLDPVIAKEIGTVSLRFQLNNCPVDITIKPESGEFTPKSIELNGNALPFTVSSNRYRTGGAVINKTELLLDKESNQLVIRL